MHGAHGAAAAAEKLRRDREEEEEAMSFTTGPSGDMEYKIIRSVTRAFKSPEKFRAILDEEARAGWDLVEKLDDGRARLRRSVAWRQKDGELSQDPYRIKVGMTEGVLALIIVASVLSGIALVLGLILLFVTHK